MGDELPGTTGAALAYKEIRTAIVEGTLPSGARLVESRWADRLSLSRTPVREAVRMLAADGLVVVEPNRGAIVRTVTREDVLDLYELRARLESYAAERAAVKARPADLAMLDAGISAFDNALARDELGTLERTRSINEANRSVHGAIMVGGNHNRLSHILQNTVDAPMVFAAFRTFDHADLVRSNLFHKLIRDALYRREPERAAGLMYEHIMLGRDQVLANMNGAAPSAQRSPQQIDHSADSELPPTD